MKATVDSLDYSASQIFHQKIQSNRRNVATVFVDTRLWKTKHLTRENVSKISVSLPYYPPITATSVQF